MNDFSKVRIVWNLTNHCPFNCPMCVASANKRIEKQIDKMAILNSILSLNKNDITIDFSGGDPLFLKEDIAVIIAASKILGRENISISSTGLSLSKLSDEVLISLAKGYDMTYDFPKKFCHLDIRDERYNKGNYEQIKRLKKLGLNVDIFVPIRDIENKYYDELAKDICELNPDSVKLLKLMPLNDNFDTSNIESIKYSKLFIEKLKLYGYKGKISINCALKEDYNVKNNCNMLSERKIGLDQYGNLYTCIWASDLLISKDDNPFYLGNLLSSSLKEILTGEKVTKYTKKLNRDKCYVLDFYKNN